jgi:hypothetical protein
MISLSIHEPIAVFYHVYLVNNWKEIVSEQFRLMQESGLYDEASTVVCGVQAKDASALVEFGQMFSGYDKLRIHSGRGNKFEYPTLKLLHDYCLLHDARVLYFHSKGVVSETGLTRPSAAGVKGWRDLMNFACLTDYQTCLRRLSAANCCGINFNGQFFSGNFWWASASYIRTIQAPERPDTVTRSYYETWISTGTGFKPAALYKKVRCNYDACNAVIRNKAIWLQVPGGLQAEEP